MSHALNVKMTRLLEAPAIPYSTNWKVLNGFKEAISGEFAPKLDNGQVVKSMNSDHVLVIQGTELGNIVVCETNVSSASPDDSVICVYYGPALAVHMEEFFGKAYLLEVLEYLFAEPENFGKKFLNFNPEIRKHLLAFHNARLQNYGRAPSAPLNERIAYFRYGTSEVIAMCQPDGMYSVTERFAPENDLPMYHVTNHTDKDKAIEEFKRCVNRALG